MSKDLSEKQRTLLSVVLIACFTMMVISFMYYYSTPCDCPDCVTQRFFLFEEVGDEQVEEEDIILEKSNYTLFIDWYDNDYSPSTRIPTMSEAKQ